MGLFDTAKLKTLLLRPKEDEAAVSELFAATFSSFDLPIFNNLQPAHNESNE